MKRIGALLHLAPKREPFDASGKRLLPKAPALQGKQVRIDAMQETTSEQRQKEIEEHNLLVHNYRKARRQYRLAIAGTVAFAGLTVGFLTLSMLGQATGLEIGFAFVPGFLCFLASIDRKAGMDKEKSELYG